ncbi:glycosyltransferase family 39 protein [Stackebrandtia nassauensis]|uniref:Membrane protein-like protein n=1 Tax=Stackebrandtia nassauensis (strain DSM 44728 / CIP 108903 / NRRL B-16338 / NBRC 102104 / LLR-40K-21) TaxID=446470 RepID=D3QBR9_STANL|nr:glycosyltransferase family 39 protein [Stackebrandtia nassauensis]ADD44808.1 membrane protein-like protein [Stackebrandtia nassauensis DSM 44728]
MSPFVRKPWLLPFLAMLAIGGLGMWLPGLWADELATWGAIEESWSQLWALLSNTDAVNGGYYVVMKLWATVFGTSEVALRLPSLVAMAIAAGLTAAIGARLWTPRWGILAGVLFALLPMTSRYAAEARGYAFSMAFAVLASYLLVRLCQRPTTPPEPTDDQAPQPRQAPVWRLWLYYGLSIAAASVFHLMAILVLCGHGLMLLALNRHRWRGWLLAATASVAALAPLALLGATQISQTSWVLPLSFRALAHTPKDLFESRWTAAALAILIVIALWRSRSRPTIAVAAWALAPVLALMLAATVVDVWVPRYLLFLVPAWAVLGVRAVAGIRWKPTAMVMLAVAFVSGAGAQYDIRRSSGHAHDTLGAAALIETGYRDGDGLAVALNEPVVPWEARDLVARYLPPPLQPDDTFATTEQRTDGQLLASECPDPAHCLGDTPRLWVVRYENHTDPLTGIGGAKEQLLRDEFTVDQVWPLRGLTVALLIRR